jgi:hypothetical protein
MSHIPTNKEIKQLVKFKESYCLTIYTPHIEWTGSTNPNRIMLKNLIRQSRIDLVAAGLKENLIERTLRPIKALLDSRHFWSTRRETLAIFAHSKFFKFFTVPDQHIPRMLNIQRGFSVEPLAHLANEDVSYVLLTLDHNNVNLYEASRYHIKPIKTKGFPASMYETLQIDEQPKSFETHAVNRTDRSKGSEALHGQYNVAQTDKTRLLQFFRQINRRLCKLLQGKKVPVVLAGVNYLLPIYRAANTYPNLVPAGVVGGGATINPESIHKQAWQLVRQNGHAIKNSNKQGNKTLK